MKESSKKKFVTNTWGGHVGKNGDEKLAKTADAQKVEGKWWRGRPKLKWGIGLKVTYREWAKNGN